MIVVKDLGMQLRAGSHVVTIIKDISFEIPQKHVVAIVGPSGSGKSTLLGLLAGLDTPTRGTITIHGTDITKLSESAMVHFRRQHIGYVFQSFHLIPTLTALENVALPLELNGDSGAADRAKELLHSVGLESRQQHYPVQLSGGEQQRVAVARAFSTRPPVLYADEPTGNLDSATGNVVIDLLFRLNQDHGSTMVLVTHDQDLAQRTQRIITLRDGQIADDKSTAPTKT
ncbi:MAG: ABC transporter ATP-binding protein [Nitrospirales bacterium]|nr:ABC transporter ATP-binding protein [Nitrospira sp.]MDR4500747.1 ABC transporter ATP-binding protein [Nitrospirales bacterium]